MQNKEKFKRKPLPAKAEAAEGAVVGRNALRELLASGRAIDKIFVQRGEREGSITVLVAQAIERKILKLEAKKTEADAAAAAALMQEEVQKRVAALVAEGKSMDDILSKLK